MWVGGQPDVFSEKRFRDRVRFISVLFAIGYSLIGLRLFYLQVIKGDALSQLSESNRTQLIFFRAPRGDIYDRRGRLLVTNRPSWSLMYSVPQKAAVDRERVN
jgi:penicillin-binding protein 2